jgi:hypothetical protein
LNKKPNILFDDKQKFFAIYDEKDGLVFSKKLRASKQRESWMRRMNEVKFKSLEDFSDQWKKQRGIFCDEKKCVIEKNQKILVLLKRNKISKICQKNFIDDFEVIVNLTSKYQLPNCISDKKIKIDNLDFYQKGGHFLYFSGDKISIKTAI